MAIAIAAAAVRAVPDEPRGGHGRHGPQGQRGTAAQRHSDRPQAIEKTKEVSKR